MEERIGESEIDEHESDDDLQEPRRQLKVAAAAMVAYSKCIDIDVP